MTLLLIRLAVYIILALFAAGTLLLLLLIAAELYAELAAPWRARNRARCSQCKYTGLAERVYDHERNDHAPADHPPGQAVESAEKPLRHARVPDLLDHRLRGGHGAAARPPGQPHAAVGVDGLGRGQARRARQAHRHHRRGGPGPRPVHRGSGSNLSGRRGRGGGGMTVMRRPRCGRVISTGKCGRPRNHPGRCRCDKPGSSPKRQEAADA